ncbi:MAG: hypothetical protein Greene041662_144 [Candidatus Peregrinibacteria bacterium Greene0416_62]|nr:MAG: hypothetical protein Greene041662_144 [Candidatus Peregrinibacteria bacterium Greene0416_62]
MVRTSVLEVVEAALGRVVALMTAVQEEAMVEDFPVWEGPEDRVGAILEVPVETSAYLVARVHKGTIPPMSVQNPLLPPHNRHPLRHLPLQLHNRHPLRLPHLLLHLLPLLAFPPRRLHQFPLLQRASYLLVAVMQK